MDYHSTENQRIIGKLVSREVYHNLCLTMQFILDRPDSEEYEEIISMAAEVPAEDLCQEEGWEEDAEGSIVKVDGNKRYSSAKEAAMDAGWELCEGDFSLVYDNGEEKVFAKNWENACELIEEVTGDYAVKELSSGEWATVLPEIYTDWEECADGEGYERYREIYEYWAVSSWFGRKLAEKGEAVADVLDFTVWGRCTTGQAILLDGVVCSIAEDMEILEGQKYSWAEEK